MLYSTVFFFLLPLIILLINYQLSLINPNFQQSLGIWHMWHFPLNFDSTMYSTANILSNLNNFDSNNDNQNGGNRNSISWRPPHLLVARELHCEAGQRSPGQGGKSLYQKYIVKIFQIIFKLSQNEKRPAHDTMIFQTVTVPQLGPIAQSEIASRDCLTRSRWVIRVL